MSTGFQIMPISYERPTKDFMLGRSCTSLSNSSIISFHSLLVIYIQKYSSRIGNDCTLFLQLFIIPYAINITKLANFFLQIRCNNALKKFNLKFNITFQAFYELKHKGYYYVFDIIPLKYSNMTCTQNCWTETGIFV